MRRAVNRLTDEPTDASARRAVASPRIALDASNWRAAAGLLEAGWPDEWGELRGKPDDTSLDDVVAEIDDSIAVLTSTTG